MEIEIKRRQVGWRDGSQQESLLERREDALCFPRIDHHWSLFLAA